MFNPNGLHDLNKPCRTSSVKCKTSSSLELPRMQSTDTDLKIRKALAMIALHDMTEIWQSNLTRNLKQGRISAAVEAIFALK